VERDIIIPGDETVFRFSVAIDRSEIKEQLDRFDNIIIYSLGALGLGLIAIFIIMRWGFSHQENQISTW